MDKTENVVTVDNKPRLPRTKLETKVVHIDAKTCDMFSDFCFRHGLRVSHYMSVALREYIKNRSLTTVNNS
jgi:hypothetical protein